MGLLVIDSKDRLSSSTSSSDFKVTIPRIPPVNKVTLIEAAIPNSIYNIRTGVNDVMKFVRSSTTHTITVPPGAYSITDLCTEIQTRMNALDSNTYTVVYNSAYDLKVKIGGAAIFELRFDLSTLYDPIGFKNVAKTGNTSYTSDNTINLGPQYLYVYIPEWSTGNNYTTNNDMFTFLVPIPANTTEVIYYTPETEQSIDFSTPQVLGPTITVQLRIRGEVVNLNNVDFTLVIKFE